MSRKATPAPASKAAPVNEKMIAEEVAANNQLAVIELAKAENSESRNLANQMLGQIQMSMAFSKFADVVSLSKLKQIKENKLYRSVAGQKFTTFEGVEIADVGTWEGFCAALGTSRAKVDEDLTNLNTFGEDALTQLNNVGIGYRDLRQFRKLPADQKSALIDAANSGDKELILELIEDLSAKSVKERTELQAELTAKEGLLTKKAQRIQELEDAEDKLHAMPMHERATMHVLQSVGLIQGKVTASFAEVVAHHQTTGGASNHVLAGFVAQMQQAINDLRDQFAVQDTVGDGTPAYKRWAQEQDGSTDAKAH